MPKKPQPEFEEITIPYDVKGLRKTVRYDRTKLIALLKEQMLVGIDIPRGMKIHKVDYRLVDFDNEPNGDIDVKVIFVSMDLP